MMEKEEICYMCNGKGEVTQIINILVYPPKTKQIKCGRCNGTGKIKRDENV